MCMSGYQIVTGVWGYSCSGHIAHIGVISHEVGHLLGKILYSCQTITIYERGFLCKTCCCFNQVYQTCMMASREAAME